MSKADIIDLEPRLLQVLTSLVSTRRTTATAAALGMTQPAVSNALKRLRAIFADPLFVRRPHGLEPTRRALELAPQAAEILALMQAALAPSRFEPNKASGVVRLGVLDYHCALITAPLLERVEEEAPGLQISFRPLTRRAAIDAVLAGELDAALGFFWNLPDPVRRVKVWSEDYAVIARRRGGRLMQLTLEDYLAARHLIVSIDGDFEGIVDQALAAKGLRRRVVAATPYFLAAASAVSTTDLLATVPTRLARMLEAPFALSVREPPLRLRRFDVSLIRAERSLHDPLINWLVSLIRKIAPRD